MLSTGKDRIARTRERLVSELHNQLDSIEQVELSRWLIVPVVIFVTLMYLVGAFFGFVWQGIKATIDAVLAALAAVMWAIFFIVMVPFAVAYLTFDTGLILVWFAKQAVRKTSGGSK